MNYLDSTKEKITISGLHRFAMWVAWVAIGTAVVLTAYGAMYPQIINWLGL